MKKLITYVLGGITLLYLASCTTLAMLQQNFLYFPTPEIERTDVEKLRLANDGTGINVWKVASNNSRAIIYFGGNAEPVSRNIDPFRKYLPGYDIYLLNYRGYGGSDGRPSEGVLYSDALMVFDQLSGDYEKISIVGRSLGSGIATYVASRREINGLALITPYDSIENVAREKFPIFPVSMLLKEKYNSIGRTHLISAPTLIITAESDGVISKRRSDALTESFTQNLLTTATIEKTTHLTVSRPQRFWEVFSAFFKIQES